MGIEDRFRRLEREANAVPDSCPECKGVIITEELLPDGSVRYPNGEPCPECGSRGSSGMIGTITIGGLDQDSERTRGDVYQLEPFED